MESLSHEKFKTKDMTEKHLLNDLNQMTEQTHITLLEVFLHVLEVFLHCLKFFLHVFTRASKIQYLPKCVMYDTGKAVAGIQFAVLDHKRKINKQKVYTNLCKYKLDRNHYSLHETQLFWS